MNDWGYACVAKLLATAIAEAATRPVASAAVPRALRLHRLQRGEHVLNDVVGMFEADRNAHQPVADAELGALRRGEPLVGRRRRMGDEALGVAEIIADADELESRPESGTRPSCRP